MSHFVMGEDTAGYLNEVGRGIKSESYNITCNLHYIYAKSLMGHVKHKSCDTQNQIWFIAKKVLN